MKNKKILVLVGLVVVVLVAVGGLFFILNNKSDEGETEENQFEENLIEMSAEDVGLTLSSQRNNQQIVMELTKLSDVETFDYEVSYEAIEEGEVVRQGTFGSGPNPDEEGETTIRRVIDLGTCSAVCRYHEGVEQVEFVLRVNLTNGETGIIEEVFILE